MCGISLDRHDDPQEKQDDQVRAEIRASHRFDSFAGQRSQCSVKWCANSSERRRFLLTVARHRHVDGHDYMYALSEILDNAKECIFILVRTLPQSLSFAFSPLNYRIGG